jgi:hypothetical protein
MKTPKLLLLLFFLIPQLSIQASTNSPEATVKAYFTALAKGDRTNANHLTARFPNFGDARVAALTDRFIELHKRPGYAPTVKNSKAIEDCAVVLIFESPTDPDPTYLIKQNGAWRVLPELTEFKYFDFSEATLTRFRDLEKWFETQVGKRK